MISIYKEERPWGRFYTIHDEQKYKLKRIEIDPGQRISNQYHTKRSESWTIVEGEGLVTLDNQETNFKSGEIIKILKGQKHRIENKTKNKLIFIEVQTGDYFGEDDIVRIDDDYNRL